MNDNDYDTVYKTVDYIASRIRDDVSVNEVSKYVGYCRRQLNRIFKDITGMSVAEYIKMMRLDLGGKAIFKGSDVNVAAYNSNLSQSSLLRGMKDKFDVLPKNLKKDNGINSCQNMGKIITIGFSTGGAGATTLSLITGALLAQTKKVLIIDASPIASASFMLAGEVRERFDLSQLLYSNLDNKAFYKLVNFGLLGAMIDQEPKKYIINLSPNFHILPNDGYLECYLPRLIYDKSLEKRILEDSFKQMIEKLKNDYDFIVVDTHYSGLDRISDFVVKASDHILIPLHARAFLASKFDRSLELIEEKGLDKNRVTAVFRRDLEVGKIWVYMEEEMKKQYEQIIFKNFLPDSESVRKAVCGYDMLMDEVKNNRIPLQYYLLKDKVCSRLA